MDRTYQDAVDSLNSLQSNYATLKAIRASGRYGANAEAIPEMVEWTRRIGYEVDQFNSLNVIHIAGTKGKGSTSAFVSSILKQEHPPLKVGLYTSPHLRTVRERIQIDNEPLSPTMFANYFFEVWDRIESSSYSSALLPPLEEKAKPNYFRFLTLVALHAFYREKVDAALLECGIGGELDSTNIVSAPVTTAVTSLGLDHTAQLGATIDSIAWHKAGIFKKSTLSKSVYTTSEQPQEAMRVLRERAAAASKTLVEVPVAAEIADGDAQLSLEGSFQKINASLACAVAADFMKQKVQLFPHASRENGLDDQILPKSFKQGLASVQWKGRCETRHDHNANLTWYLDGGHTLESVQPIAEWFVSHVLEYPELTQPRVLLFNQQTRDADVLVRALFAAVSSLLPTGHPAFTEAIFSTNTPYRPEGGQRANDASLSNITADTKAIEELSVQFALQNTVREIDKRCRTFVTPTVEEAVAIARGLAARSAHEESEEGNKVLTLATGSLHLVGGLTEVLESEIERLPS